jgi:hypothetical protein
MILGVKAEYRRRSIFALFANEMFRRCRECGGIGAECSWVLEDNEALNSPMTALGAKEYRRWRIFEKALNGA